MIATSVSFVVSRNVQHNVKNYSQTGWEVVLLAFHPRQVYNIRKPYRLISRGTSRRRLYRHHGGSSVSETLRERRPRALPARNAGNPGEEATVEQWVELLTIPLWLLVHVSTRFAAQLLALEHVARAAMPNIIGSM